MFNDHTAGEFANEVVWTVAIVVAAGVVYYGGKSITKRAYRRIRKAA